MPFAPLSWTVAEGKAVALRLNTGSASINDGVLTAMVGDVEKSSFGHSGRGPSWLGASGLLRFSRCQALLRQPGTPVPPSARAERG